MSVLHFLNVKQGDCSWIQHNSGRVSVVDVCNAKKLDILTKLLEAAKKAESAIPSAPGNFNQKAHPVNPIYYLDAFGVGTIFRFIVSHPDMDHLDGIKALFESFAVVNFWDTNNQREITDFDESGYAEDDWVLYTALRNGKIRNPPRRLALHSGDHGEYYNCANGDGLTILAPCPDLVDEANRTADYNNCSYVILYQTSNRKVIFGGDSHDKTWDFILENHSDKVANIDILIAPHHGRKSSRSYKFLDVLKPKLTFFGNANSEHLAYSAWNNRNLKFITNNQANCIVANISKNGIGIYVTNESFARSENSRTFYDEQLRAWFLGAL